MPIHEDDINQQTAALLDAASVPARIVNWGGDDPVSVQEWCAFFAELTGHEVPVDVVETPGTLRGSIADPTTRTSITGPCRVPWKDGLRAAYVARYG
jgi:nucleoside-diphosphate-sugar epimerase